MKANILTIDWDYFFNAPLSVRDERFPNNPNGALDFKPDNSIWLDYICPEVTFDRDSFNKIYMAIGPHQRFKGFFLSENHGEMYKVVKYLISEGFDDFSITNIDFHHDYSYNGSVPYCDNWFRLIDDMCPKCEKWWCKREDSVTTTFGDEVPLNTITLAQVVDNIERKMYDYIHLCRSDLYSPPSNDCSFEDLALRFMRRSDLVHKLALSDRTLIGGRYEILREKMREVDEEELSSDE